MNKPKTARTVDTKKVSGFDVCQTPPHALEPLYPYLNKEWLVWESAAGPERILEDALLAQGFKVTGTDLLYGDCYNFFTYAPTIWDIQITNPPFSLKYKWLQRSFELGKRFCLLAPYETTFAKEFQVLFKRYNGNPWYIEILSPERRINYKMPSKGWDSSAQMPTCWITWGLGVVEAHNVEDILYTYYMPMRKAKYNDNNEEV